MDHLKLAQQFLKCKTAELVLIGLGHWEKLTPKEKKKAFPELELAAKREEVYYRRFTGSIKDVNKAERKIRAAYRKYIK